MGYCEAHSLGTGDRSYRRGPETHREDGLSNNKLSQKRMEHSVFPITWGSHSESLDIVEGILHEGEGWNSEISSNLAVL